MATITVPEVVPSPVEDCETLMNAFRGLGTDEKAIIRTLGHRNASQRQEILDSYQLLYEKPLSDDLHSEISGPFKDALILWLYGDIERDARIANAALKSSTKGVADLQVIVELACVPSPNYLIAVRQAYCSLFDCSLEEDIMSEVPVPVRKVLFSLVSSFRHYKEVVNSTIASEEACKLNTIVEAKNFDDEELIMILSTRNVFQLRETFKCYRDSYWRSIDQDLMACGDGILESLLKAVVLCIECPHKHFAEVIRTSIDKLGTNEDSLTRVIVSRAEHDLMNIREEYNKAYGSNLDDAIAGDTSGDYQDFLLTLLGADI